MRRPTAPASPLKSAELSPSGPCLLSSSTSSLLRFIFSGIITGTSPFAASKPGGMGVGGASPGLPLLSALGVPAGLAPAAEACKVATGFSSPTLLARSGVFLLAANGFLLRTTAFCFTFGTISSSESKKPSSEESAGLLASPARCGVFLFVAAVGALGAAPPCFAAAGAVGFLLAAAPASQLESGWESLPSETSGSSTIGFLAAARLSRFLLCPEDAGASAMECLEACLVVVPERLNLDNGEEGPGGSSFPPPRAVTRASSLSESIVMTPPLPFCAVSGSCVASQSGSSSSLTSLAPVSLFIGVLLVKRAKMEKSSEEDDMDRRGHGEDGELCGQRGQYVHLIIMQRQGTPAGEL
mmetsp:Transcript_33309/g.94382  ORF Transcript_33309/g.94382 Transcript_33309/m.94382 type:complete len:355 (-) Transcript_33309:225-1289(-)